MRIDPRFLGWGVFFVIAGGIPLAVQAGVIDGGALADAWRFWPLLLVAAGLGILLRATPAHFVGGLLAAATFGLIVGGILGAGSRLDLGGVACGPGSGGGRAFAPQTGALGNGSAVSLELDCGQLDLATNAGSSWTVEGSSYDGTAPTVDATPDRLAVRSRSFKNTFPGLGDRHETWRVTVPSSARDYSVTLNAGSARLGLGGTSLATLSATVNAGSLTADLTSSPLSSLSVTVNAGSAKLDLPDAAIAGSMTVNAGGISFCVPPSVGLQITANDNLTGGNNYGDRGLTKTGNTWTSANWSTATNRITLNASANAGAFTLNPQEGCK